jgi:arylsulfatase A
VPLRRLWPHCESRVLFFLVLVGWMLGAGEAVAVPPNIVLILADDLGYGDLHCYNPESKVLTPHLDQLAAGGLRFTDAHTPSSVCTPTRYGLLTGRYCWRTRLKNGVLDGFSPPLIEADRPTVASWLRDQGYATACFGKWHLGMQWTRRDGTPETADKGVGHRGGEEIDCTRPITGGPCDRGFDTYFGISASLDMAPYTWIENDRCAPLPDTEWPDAKRELLRSHSPGVGHSTFRLEAVLPTLQRRSVAWIDSHAETAPAQPFFLYLPLNSPHLPAVPSAEFGGRSSAGVYGDFVAETDAFVGAVVAALERRQQFANTLILFTSDNGGLWHSWTPQETDDVAAYKPTPRAQYTAEFGHHSNGSLRGTKADVYEGGHRVPFIVSWPGSGVAPQVVATPVELTDVFATIADVVGTRLPQAAAPDSCSFAPLLGRPRLCGEERTTLVHHSLQGVFAVREGDWKYVESRGSGGFSTPKTVTPRPGEATTQLYNLAHDPAETTNLALRETVHAERLKARLDAIRQSERLRP